MATQVLILAAGRGSRMGPKTHDIPKPLLQIGSKFLIEHQLEMFADAGVGPVGIVVGYQADEIGAVVGIRADYMKNPRWATTNSLYSFYLARDWVRDDLLVLNCDVFFHPEILDRLLAAGGDCFAYDSRSGKGREHMKVRLQDGHLVEMGKDLAAQHTHGENVGILYFKAATARLLFDEAESWLRSQGSDDWLGAAVQRLAQRVPIRGTDISPLPWAEIDFAYDLDRARKQVLPAIQGGTPRVRRRTLVLATAGLALAGLMQTAFYTSSDSQQQREWEEVEFETGHAVEIISPQGKRQAWWLVESGQSAEVEILGPDTIRLESRLVLPSLDAEARPYILGVALDDEKVQWLTCSATPSRSARWAAEIVAKRNRNLVDIPPGVHRIRVELHSIAGESCLVRLRQAERVTDDET